MTESSILSSQPDPVGSADKAGLSQHPYEKRHRQLREAGASDDNVPLWEFELATGELVDWLVGRVRAFMACNDSDGCPQHYRQTLTDDVRQALAALDKASR